MADKTIRFLLNNEVKTLTNSNPNTSVLQYLRNEQDRCGTKEGCASGDCGACTVVIAELNEADGDELQYKTVNACITLLPSLHGKQLITVEDLKDGDRLHPAQQSMVDCHGSQCGFCTPGFVMSLFALQKNHAAPSKHETQEALAGNLCRCTGYRAIVDAAAHLTESATDLDKGQKSPKQDQFDRQRAETIRQLKEINKVTTTELGDGEHHAFTPANIDELAQLLQDNPHAKLLAGGTDLALVVTQQLKELDTLIYVGKVPELLKMTETDTTLSVGASLPYSDFNVRLTQEHPEFGAMVERLGSLQIRNQGTLGGNIGNASPIGDMPPVLIALGATMTLRQGTQERSIPVEDYFIDYKVTSQKDAEFIQSVEIPKAKVNHHLKVYKISKRIDDDISSVLAAFHLCVEDNLIKTACIAYGGMAAIPKRASHCEAALLGQPWNQATIERATAALEQDFTPLTDARASEQYRMQVAKNLLQKCYLELENPTAKTRVVNYY